MRLIDADELEQVLSNNISDDRGGYLTTQEIANNEAIVDTMLIIHEQPAVDAIPVEWIEQYKQSIGSQTLVGYRWIEKMQIAWAERREDETD